MKSALSYVSLFVGFFCIYFWVKGEGHLQEIFGVASDMFNAWCALLILFGILYVLFVGADYIKKQKRAFIRELNSKPQSETETVQLDTQEGEGLDILREEIAIEKCTLDGNFSWERVKEEAQKLSFMKDKNELTKERDRLKGLRIQKYSLPSRPSHINSSRSNSRHHEGIMRVGQEGEERVKRLLQQLAFANTVINDKYIDNIHSVKDAQIDHFVVSEKGIVMIETKNYAGEIDMTDEKQWIQTIPTGERRACSNAYYQSVTHMQIMKNLMEEHGFGDVKLYAIVVFANEKTIYHGLENYHGYVMKYDAMNYFITGLPACEAMKDKQRQDEIIRWIKSFKDANSYDR